MGVNDRRRFSAFADFVHRTYPNLKTVADIAGGLGNLSFFLTERGFHATIIDERETNLPRRFQRTLRKRSAKDGRLVQIPRVVRRFQDVDLGPFDLIVALHPDQATEYAIRAALELNKDFAVIPCCVFPIDGMKRSEDAWRKYLVSLSPDILTETLPFDGANTVLYRRQE